MGRIRRLVTVCAVAALAVSMLAPATSASPGAAADRVDVIAVFDEDVRGVGAAEAVARRHGLELGFVYQHALQGFSGSVPEGRLAALENDPRIAYVEIDAEATIVAQEVPTGIRRVYAHDNKEIPTDGGGGQVDATIAVLDTGIDASHPDLHVTRAVECMSHSGGPPHQRTYSCSAGGSDGHGHGTHVAGTAAALDNDLGVVGVAPGARLWAVKVLDDRGSGNASTVIAGLDYVADNAPDVDVANMSIGFGGIVTSVDEAIGKVDGQGVAVVASAGNDSEPAENSSPGSAKAAIVVAALADYDGEPGGEAGCPSSSLGCDDRLASFSNYGEAVDLIAPGVRIRSTFPGGGTWQMSGTSMSAPHVAGAAALLASSQTRTPGEILAALQGAGNNNWFYEESPDGGEGQPPHYPLLDVGDATVFAPTFATEDDPADPDPVEDVTVTISEPANGAEVSGTVTLRATTTGDVETVSFTVDGGFVGEAVSDEVGEWAYNWDSTGVDDGSYPLMATATDTAGVSTSSGSVEITVANTTAEEPPPGEDGVLACTIGGAYCVSSLTGTATSLGRGLWEARLDVGVVNGAGEAVEGVTVAVSYVTLRGAEGAFTEDTSADGAATFSVELHNRDSEVTFTVGTIDGAEFDTELTHLVIR